MQFVQAGVTSQIPIFQCKTQDQELQTAQQDEDKKNADKTMWLVKVS